MLTIAFTALAGALTGARAVQIHPLDYTITCLQVNGNLENGTPVNVQHCTDTSTQWTYSPGSTKVQVTGTNFCLDAGSAPVNGVQLKIWECYDGLPAQQWWATGDNRIALQDQGLCVDLTGGNINDGTPAQTWQCADGNNNQVWTSS